MTTDATIDRLDVLIPTFERPCALPVTLTSLAYQDHRAFRIIVADQSHEPVAIAPEVQAAILFLHHRGIAIEIVRNVPRRGLAQQRQFLLDRSNSAQILFLDDDLILEPWVIGQMTQALTASGCGFIGSAVIGLSYAEDHRPHEQAFEFWPDDVQPERIDPGCSAWSRHKLHNAANLLHVQQAHGLTPNTSRLYKIAWTGGCVLYDRAKLVAAGGFEFWRQLPTIHAGEDVQAQRQVMARFGGAGIMPSGVYHQELETTIPDRTCDAPHVIDLI